MDWGKEYLVLHLHKAQVHLKSVVVYVDLEYSLTVSLFSLEHNRTERDIIDIEIRTLYESWRANQT